MGLSARVTNEKQLVSRAGLSEINEVLEGLSSEPNQLLERADAARALLTAAMKREALSTD